METVVKTLTKDEQAMVYSQAHKRRTVIRYMSEDEWIEQHGSGTLRKNKRIGFTYRTQYLAERVAYEFGYGFQILPRSQITFGDPITEGDCHSITECGWHIERFMNMDVFDDKVQAKYIHASFRDETKKEGVGIIVRETSAPWLPAGHIVFAIIAEFNPYTKEWEDAINPF